MKRIRISKVWMWEYVNDQYVQFVKKDGWCLCVVFKLMEIDDKDKLFWCGEVVVDFGVMFGGWLQIVVKWVGDGGMVVVFDLIEMDFIYNVDFIQGDFCEDDVFKKLEEKFSGCYVGFVMFDMVFNMLGVLFVDQVCIMYLVELGFEFFKVYLKLEGVFLVKVF